MVGEKKQRSKRNKKGNWREMYGAWIGRHWRWQGVGGVYIDRPIVTSLGPETTRFFKSDAFAHDEDKKLVEYMSRENETKATRPIGMVSNPPCGESSQRSRASSKTNAGGRK